MDKNMKPHMKIELTQRDKDLITLSKLRLMDDDFMTMVFDSDIEATQLLLNVILKRADLIVVEAVAQREYKTPNAGGRSIKIDIYAKDSAGKVYDIEIQREDKGAGPQRARFNSSMIDTRMLKSGEDFSNLRESYVIFITENDVLNHGLALYHIDRRIEETDEFFGDGSHIIYVNGSYMNDANPIGKLMHDFRCTSADNMYYNILADRVRYFKENERGRESMCKLLEDMRNETEIKRSESIALNLLEIGKMSVEEIASATGLTVECVNNLAGGMTS